MAYDPVASAESLLAILKREHAALLAGETEAIEQIAAEKHRAVAVIESLSHEFSLKADAVPAADREHFLNLAGECRRQNEINGSMVMASLRHLQQFIALLHGHDPQSSVYQRAGQSQAGFESRPLAKA